VTLVQRVRADLAKPEVPTSRDELPFLVGCAALIIVVTQLLDPGDALDLLVVAPAVLAFAARGLIPRLPAEVFAALVIVPVVAAVGRDGALEGTFFLVAMMTFEATAHLESLVRSAIITVAGAASALIVAELLAPDSGIAWEPWAMANLFVFALGRTQVRQRRLIEQLERAREALADQAVAEERRRIARELHDLAGHTLAAVLLHVTGARHVLRRGDQAEAERALADAETVGRASLDQIRATVASLRTDERGTDPALSGAADLPALVADYRRAGLAIETSIAAPAADLAGPVGTAVHRVAREGLANVARHAPGNRVTMTLDVDGSVVRLVVADRGRPASPPDPDALHFGLVGMAERARALGGEFEAGPTADGWRIEVRLPLTATTELAAP
jgi:signal transduction histidine kinase